MIPGRVDIDRCVASWRERGYIGYDAAAVPYSDDDIARERQCYSNETRERIPVVQQELRVGKRAVQRGGVRVYNRSGGAVEQQVSLREEHVKVDRRKTDRPATDADVCAHDEVVDRKIRLPPATTGALHNGTRVAGVYLYDGSVLGSPVRTARRDYHQ